LFVLSPSTGSTLQPSIDIGVFTVDAAPAAALPEPSSLLLALAGVCFLGCVLQLKRIFVKNRLLTRAAQHRDRMFRRILDAAHKVGQAVTPAKAWRSHARWLLPQLRRPLAFWPRTILALLLFISASRAQSLDSATILQFIGPNCAACAKQ